MSGIDDKDDLSDLEDYRPRNPWPARIFAVFVVFGGVCAVSGWWFTRVPHTEPTRIVVAVQLEDIDGTVGTWWGASRTEPPARAAARVHDAMAKGFELISLEVVSRELQPALDGLDAAGDTRGQRKAAAQLGAAWLLTGAVKTTSAQPIGDTEWVEYTFESHLELVPTTGSDPAVPLPSPVRFRARGGNPFSAMESIAVDIAKLAAPPALDALAAQPRLRPYVAPEGLPMDQQIVADQLRRFFRYTADRTAALEAHALREAQGADIERGWGVNPDERIGPWLGWEVMLGPTHDGRIVLKVDELRAELPITERAVELTEVHETLVLAQPDGSDRQRLFDAYNFYGWPRVSPDGRWITGVLDERGLVLTLVQIRTEDGAVRRLRSHAEHEYSSPMTSPAGDEVAYWWQPCRGCDMELRIVGVDGGEPRTVFHNVQGSGGSPSWSPDGQFVYLSITPPGRPGSVWKVQAQSGEKTAIAGPGDGLRGSSFSGARLAPDGRYVAAMEVEPNGKQHLSLISTADKGVERLFHGVVEGLVISPDSADIGFRFQPEGSWSYEIGVLDAESGAMEQLTHSRRNHYLGSFSRDGTLLYTSLEEGGATQFYRTYAHPVP